MKPNKDINCIGCNGVNDICRISWYVIHTNIIERCPCENCLVKVMCVDACDELRDVNISLPLTHRKELNKWIIL